MSRDLNLQFGTFELFYSDGGHVGPYKTLQDAIEACKDKLESRPNASFEMTIRRSTTARKDLIRVRRAVNQNGNIREDASDPYADFTQYDFSYTDNGHLIDDRAFLIHAYTAQIGSWLYLRDNLKPGSKVFCILRHVSKSGMSRDIDFYGNSADGLNYLTGHIANVLDLPRSKNQGLRIGGVGMDMGFHVVHSLSYVLHGTQDTGEDAIGAGIAGRPYRPTQDAYRAGYSLTHDWI